MVSYHSSVQQLCKFAYSPRMHTSLHSQLVVVRVQPYRLPAALISEGDVLLVTKKAFDQTAFVQEWPEQPSLELTERYIESIKDVKTFLHAEQGAPTRHTTTLAPHAEQTLLLHHLKSPDIAPFSYVAVSKLPCLLCSKAFDAYRQWQDNAGGGLKLWVRGSHSKLYYPWQPPTMEFSNNLILATNVRDALWGALVRIYSAWLAEQNAVRLRTLSDSTNQSGTKQYLGPDDECEDQRRAEAARKYDECWAKRGQE